MTAAWWPQPRRRAAHAGWQRVLLLLDPDVTALPEPVVRVAVGLTSPDGVLDVLVPVLVPLSSPLEAPPGEETERAAMLLESVERLAGRHGVPVHGHLVRGRSLRTMLR